MARVWGGQILKRTLRRAGRGSVKKVKVGLFSSARYPDGTPVTNVAAWNEFGTSRAPARPFMRNANANRIREPVRALLAARLDGHLIVDHKLASQVGNVAKREYQQEIRELDRPPNAPATVARKKSENPLIDTGKLRQSITHEVVRWGEGD